MKLQKRNGTFWLQADRRFTVDDKSSVNTLTGFSPVLMAPIQEGGAASSTDVAEQFPDPAEVGKTSKESVSIEQGQPLRAAEPDQCALKVRAKPIPETPTQRQRDIHELTHLPPVSWCPACVYRKAADGLHRRRQDTGESALNVASFDHAVSHSSGSVAAVEGPKDVTEYMARFVCDMLETWGFGVCILKCQNEPAEIALQNAVVRTRQVKTIPRNTTRYSHGSLGHCESAIKDGETATCNVISNVH